MKSKNESKEGFGVGTEREDPNLSPAPVVWWSSGLICHQKKRKIYSELICHQDPKEEFFAAHLIKIE